MCRDLSFYANYLFTTVREKDVSSDFHLVVLKFLFKKMSNQIFIQTFVVLEKKFVLFFLACLTFFFVGGGSALVFEWYIGLSYVTHFDKNKTTSNYLLICGNVMKSSKLKKKSGVIFFFFQAKK